MGLSSQDYTDLFTALGRLVKSINEIREMATGSTVSGTPRPNLPDLLYDGTDGVAVNFADVERYDVIDELVDVFEGFQDGAARWADTLAAFGDRLFSNRPEVVEKLPGLQNTDVQSILAEIIKDMNANSKTIAQNVVALGSETYVTGNNGDGLVVSTLYLDGVTPPSPGYLAHEDYNDVKTELILPETMLLECVADSQTDGLPEGEETFEVRGGLSSGAKFGWRTEGSGVRKRIQTLNSSQIVANKDWELWSSDAPSGWTVETGTAGTHIVQESNASNVLRGSSSLKLVGDGSLAEIKLSQAISQGLLVPNRMYCLAIYVKGNASLAQGSLTVQFESPSGAYTASSTQTGGVAERIVMNAAALQGQTSYGLEHYFIIAPAIIPEDLKLAILLNGTPTNAQPIYLDSLAFGPVDYVNGFGIGIVAGADPWLRRDRIEKPVANVSSGIFQEYFRRQYSLQLPSSGSPSIADSLAT